jgi:uncharacterized membrane protein YphA (DoxX/SURF4 family)
LVITYLLTLLLGSAIAFGVASAVGLLLPAAKIPVFIVLTLAWLVIGWRYAQARDRGDV